MRAAWFEEFGAASDVLKLGEIDKPEPGPGEVLVHMHTSGINPSDAKKRAGSFPDLLDGFLGRNALAFLGVTRSGSKARARLRAFYDRHGLADPPWWGAS